MGGQFTRQSYDWRNGRGFWQKLVQRPHARGLGPNSSQRHLFFDLLNFLRKFANLWQSGDFSHAHTNTSRHTRVRCLASGSHQLESSRLALVLSVHHSSQVTHHTLITCWICSLSHFPRVSEAWSGASREAQVTLVAEQWLGQISPDT